MCGLAGFLSSPSAEGLADIPRLLSQMGNALRHRGPDDSGTWLDKDAGMGFIHTRLSVLDLSPAGHQPMVSTSGRFLIAFNGEIYNHLELRELLEAAGAAR